MPILKAAELWELHLPLRFPFETSFGREEVKSCLLVHLICDGVDGWGEVPALVFPRYNEEFLKGAEHLLRDLFIPGLMNKTLPTPEEFYRHFSWVRGNHFARAGVEMALWDILGKIQNQPLSVLLGAKPISVPVGVSIGIHSDIPSLCESIKFFLDQGYGRIKIKIKPEKDVEVVKAIREEFGDLLLQVDANAAYLKEEGQFLEELDRFSLLMIEQPFSARDFAGHSELQKNLQTPICLDESIVCEEDVETAHRLGSARIINIKPARVGGIFPAKKLAEKANQLGFSCWVGGLLETGIGRAANVSLACLPFFTFPGDISASDRYFLEDIIDPPFILQKGSTLSAPSSPGLGVAPLISRLKQYGVRIHQWR